MSRLTPNAQGAALLDDTVFGEWYVQALHGFDRLFQCLSCCKEWRISAAMAKDCDKTLLDGSDRLQRIAFWYWEYMRRNPLYQRYCAVIESYNDYFKDIGIYEFMQTREFLDEMTEYVSTHDDEDDLKYTLFRRRLEKSHGKYASLKFFNMDF